MEGSSASFSDGGLTLSLRATAMGEEADLCGLARVMAVVLWGGSEAKSVPTVRLPGGTPEMLSDNALVAPFHACTVIVS